MTLDSQMLLMTFNFLLFFSADAFVFFGKQKGCNLDGWIWMEKKTTKSNIQHGLHVAIIILRIQNKKKYSKFPK